MFRYLLVLMFFCAVSLYHGAASAQSDGSSIIAVSDAIPVLGEPTSAELAKFRVQLLKASQAAVKSGEITWLQSVKLQFATRNKEKLREAYDCCAERVLIDGKAKTYAAIDWNALLEFLKVLLPILIDLFG